MFLPVVAAIYFSLVRFRFSLAARAWLVLASLLFYGYWNASYTLLILTSILVNFGIGGALAAGRGVKHKPHSLGLGARKAVLFAGVSFNLLLLGYYKYCDFFIHNLNWVSGSHIKELSLVLPLAISFFTFQQVAYLVDSYQKKTDERDFLGYCLFVSFFPQLIAGPIVHHKEMMPQFGRLRNLVPDWNNIAHGVFIFSVGLFKKVVIADTFAIWANAGFHPGAAPGFADAWAASFSYTFQLYYDFSGYTDMAIGSALLFNIRLPINFNSPYKAADIQDFWRRWHMTLSRWMKDYLYIPLGGNRMGAARTYLNLFLTFLIVGLWHGAGWTFVAWGCLHGLAMLVHRAWKQAGMGMPRLLGWFITFAFVNFSWVLFRAESFHDASQVYAGMLGFNGLPSQFPLAPLLKLSEIGPLTSLIADLQSGNGAVTTLSWIYILLFSSIAFLLPNSVQMARFIENDKHRFFFKPSLGFAFATALLIFSSLLSFIGGASPSEFLYFNF